MATSSPLTLCGTAGVPGANGCVTSTESEGMGRGYPELPWSTRVADQADVRE